MLGSFFLKMSVYNYSYFFTRFKSVLVETDISAFNSIKQLFN